MANLIASEKDKAKKNYRLKSSNGVVEISADNVAKVEAMIFHSEYGRDMGYDTPKNARYLIHRLKELHDSDTQENIDKIIGELKKTSVPKKKRKGEAQEQDQDLEDLHDKESIFKYCIKNIVARLDTENSTHLNADKKGREELAERICELGFDKLYEALKDTKEYSLIKRLTEPTEPENTDKSKQYRARKNFSFATKFCHYMCMYLFEKEEEQDNFSIYDKIVAKSLPFYNEDLKRKAFIFNSKKDDPVEFYRNYQKALDKIREGKNISRNGLDHLLWWFHRSAPPKQE